MGTHVWRLGCEVCGCKVFEDVVLAEYRQAGTSRHGRPYDVVVRDVPVSRCVECGEVDSFCTDTAERLTAAVYAALGHTPPRTVDGVWIDDCVCADCAIDRAERGVRPPIADAVCNFSNEYECERCGARWTLEGDSAHDDRCPECDLACTPYASAVTDGGEVNG